MGAAHAFGGLLPTLEAARSHLAPGDRVVAAGWLPVHGHVSTRQECDHDEWSWTGSLARWALDHPDDPDAAQALGAVETHRREWLHGYRGTLGFLTLLLRPTAPGQAWTGTS